MRSLHRLSNNGTQWLIPAPGCALRIGEPQTWFCCRYSLRLPTVLQPNGYTNLFLSTISYYVLQKTGCHSGPALLYVQYPRWFGDTSLLYEQTHRDSWLASRTLFVGLGSCEGEGPEMGYLATSPRPGQRWTVSMLRGWLTPPIDFGIDIRQQFEEAGNC